MFALHFRPFVSQVKLRWIEGEVVPTFAKASVDEAVG